MSERTDGQLLGDVEEAIRRIGVYVASQRYEEFCADLKTQDSVLRNLEVIGEACRHVSEALRAESPDVPWKSMAGMRDRLIHDYAGVNLDIVWQVVSAELPGLADRIRSLARGRNPNAD